MLQKLLTVSLFAHVMSAGMAGCIVRGPVSLHKPEEVDSVNQHTAAAGTRAGMQHDAHILPCPHLVTCANPYSSVLLLYNHIPFMIA